MNEFGVHSRSLVVACDLAEAFHPVNLVDYGHDRQGDKVLPRLAGKHPAPDLGSAVPVALVHRRGLHSTSRPRKRA